MGIIRIIGGEVVVEALASTAKLETDAMAVVLMYVPEDFEIALITAVDVEPNTVSANAVKSVDADSLTL